jgi:hypothetical protein
MKRGAPRREKRGRLALGRVLGSGKATLGSPWVEERNPLPKNGTWG